MLDYQFSCCFSFCCCSIHYFSSLLSLLFLLVMQSSLYFIFDSKAQSTTGPLMTFPNDAVARRTFQDALTSDHSVLGAHPEDYSLHRVGSFDPESGVIEPLEGGCHHPESHIVSGDMIMEILRRQQESSNG